MTVSARRRVFTRVQSGASLLSSTALAALMMTMPHAAHALDANALPTGGTIVGGGATILQSSPDKLDINQTTDRTVINWDSFNIGSSATTQFYQPSSHALAVNRVTGAGEDPAKIEGTLIANGKVMVLDRNGVIFGKGSMINVNGIVASTGDVSTQAVMNGDTNLTVSNIGDGAIVNDGTINAGQAGLVAFVGKNVANNGTINATLGSVALAATGTTATIDLTGDGLVTLAPGGATGKVLAENAGTINAAGGHVAITAAAAKDAVDDVINMSGVVNASSVTQNGGDIILSGGDTGSVNVTGALLASGKTGGGAIAVSGKNVTVGSGAVLAADATIAGNGGKVTIKAKNKAQFDGIVLARGGSESGNGGSVEISGATLGYTGFVDTLAPHGATGSLLLDPVDVTIDNLPGDGSTDEDQVNAQDIANTLKYSNVDITADTSVTVADTIDVSIWQNEGGISFAALPKFSADIGLPIFPISSSGITTNLLTLTAPTVNISHDVTLGTGGLTVDATTLNLDGRIYQRAEVGGDPSLANASQMDSSAGTINIISNNALIGQGLQFAKTDATINVGAGIYDEDLTIDKGGITLSGAGGQLTHLTPHSPGIVVTGSGDTVEGMYITGATNGIFVDNAGGVKVLNNDVEDSSANGIYFVNSAGGDVEGNTVKNTGTTGHGIAFEQGSNGGIANNNTVTHTGYNGIYSTGSAGMDFENNTISEAGYTTTAAHGISIENGDGTITDNTISSLADGILLYRTTDASQVSGNTVTAAGRYGIDAESANGATISGNDVSNTALAGINVVSSNSATVSGNKVYKTGADGIAVSGGTSITVSTNDVGTKGDNVDQGANNINGDGIYVTGAKGVTAQGNTITETTSTGTDIGSGIQIVNSNGVVVGGENPGQGNIISDTGWDGIRLSKTPGATVNGNTISDVTRSGIFINNTVGGVVDDNTISGTSQYYGIHFEGSKNLVASDNTISDTALDGIHADIMSGTTTISGNTIDDTGRDGIEAVNVDGLSVAGNMIGQSSDITGSGIYASGATAAQIYGNTISRSGIDGIYLSGDANAVVSGNTIQGTDTIFANGENGADANGIEAQNSAGVTISSNTIAAGESIFGTGGNGAGLDGILVNGSDGAQITGNDVLGGFDFAIVGGGDGAGTNGIELTNSNGALIGGNSVYGGNGASILPAGFTTNDYGAVNDAILATGDGNSVISGNTIMNVGGNGIEASDSPSLQINNNVIGALHAGDKVKTFNIGGDGILLTDSDDAVIQGNTVKTAYSTANLNDVGNGIYVIGSDSVLVGGYATGQGNTVSGVSWDDIKLSGDTNATVQGNTLGTANRTNIYVLDSANTQVLSNTGSDSRLTGYGAIWVDGGSDATVYGNTLNNGLAKGASYGVEFTNVGGDVNYVTDNTINLIKRDGVYVTGTEEIEITNNLIGTSGAGSVVMDGIYADGMAIGDVSGNTILNVGQNAIEVANSPHVLITDNLIGALHATDKVTTYNVGGDGILVTNSDDAVIQGNTIKTAYSTANLTDVGSGIYVIGSDGVLIGGSAAGQGNTVSGVSWDDIKVRDDSNTTVEGNTLGTANRTNVYALDSTGTTIENNTGSDSRLTGYGAIWVDGGSDAIVTGNTLNNGLGKGASYGIEFSNVGGNANAIGDNTINLIKHDGIYVTGTDELSITDNLIGTASAGSVVMDGIYADGLTSGTISGNTVMNVGQNAIEVANSPSVQITNNLIGALHATDKVKTYNVGGDGILLTDSDDAVIQGNVIKTAYSTANLTDVGSGIYVIGSDGVTIGGSAAGQGNTVSGVSWDDIKVRDDSNTTVEGNTLGTANRTNVYAEDSTGTTIENNTGSDSRLTGYGAIWVDGGSDATVSGNTLNNGLGKGASYGVEFTNVDGTNLIDSNTINLIKHDAIHVTDDNNLSITNNIIGNSGPGSIVGYGIYADGLTGTSTISGNHVSNTGSGAVYVDPSPNMTISDNIISNAGGDGIDAVDEDGLTISGNMIDGSASNGIEVSGGSDITVSGNMVTNSGEDGIYVHDVGGEVFFPFPLAALAVTDVDAAPTADVSITGNTVDFTGNNGIEVGNVDSSYIDSNKIGTAGLNENGTNIGGDGIYVYGEDLISDLAETSIFFPFGNVGTTIITNNTVANTAYNGIEADNLVNADIEANTADSTGGDGIYANNINPGFEFFALAADDDTDASDNDLTISGNFIGQNGFVTGNGISVYDSGLTTIAGNMIGAVAAPVVTTTTRSLAVVDGSTGGVGGNGIDVENNENDVTISSNTITAPSLNGIYVSDADGITVTSNIITNAGANGLYVAGPDNGYVALSGNTFTDNPTGALFESGTIDMTGDANTFNGGDTALLFSPALIDSAEEGGFTFTFAKADIVGDPVYADLTLVDNTIGSTVFNGQTTNYVQFANGAFFEPGEPTIIDGLNATYDGLLPSLTGGVENNTQYESIENKVYHYNDDPTLGLLFFGFVQDTTADNTGFGAGIGQNDIYERIAGYQTGPHSFRVTVLGLPNTGQTGGGNTGGTPQTNSLGTSAELLANVAPAAGGPYSGAGQLNQITPAAGNSNGNGKTSGCWSQTISNAAAGISTSYTFGGSPEANMSGLAACGT